MKMNKTYKKYLDNKLEMDAQIKHHTGMLDILIEKNKKLISALEANIMDELGIKPGDTVTLHLLESRDDTVHYFQAEQTVKLQISGVYLKPGGVIAPILNIKGRKRKVVNNWYLGWELYKGDVKILENIHENTIIDGIYPDIEETRKRAFETQRIK
jgi:hypothetical protein